MLTQIIKIWGSKVIGRVSSQEKVEIVRQAGADHVIVDASSHFAEEVVRLADGTGPVSWKVSLDALRRCGTLCWFGPVLGGPGPVEITSIPKSIKIGYAVFMDHVSTPDLLRAHSAQLFNWIIEGRLKVHIGGTYPLADAARAHADMESRRTTGKLLLIP